MNLDELKKEYELKKASIKLRLSDFKKIRTHEQIFYEMCYCIMTANGSAAAGRRAQKRLEETNFLGTGIIGECVEGVRYCENKKKFLSWIANTVVHSFNPGKKGKLRTAQMSFERVEYKGLGNFLWNSAIKSSKAPLWFGLLSCGGKV